MNQGTASVKPMTSRQRVLAALARQPVDRTPVCNPTSVATVELMDLVGAHFPDANRDAEKMARLAATGYTELGFDTIMPVFFDHSRIICPWLQYAVGSEGQLANRTDE